MGRIAGRVSWSRRKSLRNRGFALQIFITQDMDLRATRSKLFRMLIGQRLRDIREAKNLSQDDIERATGLARTYISRVENGHTVPSLETLEKWARALGMALSAFLRR